MSDSPYRFMGRAGAAMLPALLFVAAAEAVLWRSGETVPIRRIAHRHPAGSADAIYMPRFMGEEIRQLHYERLRRHMPDLLVLGSSRVERFRAEMFGPGADVYNACHSIRYAGEVEEFVRLACATSVPRIVLVGVDTWWFNRSADRGRGAYASDMAEDGALLPNAHAVAIGRLARDIAGLRIGSSLLGRTLRWGGDAPDGIRRYGFHAWVDNGVFGDGSRRWWPDRDGIPLRGRVPWDAADARRLYPTVRAYQPWREIDADLLHCFFASLEALERRGARIVGFAVPFSRAARDFYHRNQADYSAFDAFVPRLTSGFTARGWPFVDGSSPEMVGLTDASMRDAYHPSESYCVRVLERISNECGVTVTGWNVAQPEPTSISR